MQALSSFFKIQESGSTLSREFIAGLITFLSMAYIVVVNPLILADAGLDKESVFIATALASALCSIFMALVAGLPFALAPGMGVNAFFTYTLVLGMGYSPSSAFAGIFVAGLLMAVISATPLRRMLISAMPHSLKVATTVGVGLFIAFIGLRAAGLVVDQSATLVTLVKFHSKEGLSALLSLFGLFLLLGLHHLKVTGDFLIALVVTTILAMLFGFAPLPSGFAKMPNFGALRLFDLDFIGFFGKPHFIGALFALFLVIFFGCNGDFCGAWLSFGKETRQRRSGLE